MKYRRWMLFLLAAATAAILLFPIHRATREANAVMDMGHVVLFGALALAVRRLLRGGWTHSEARLALLSWLAVVSLGIAGEVAQAAVGRHPSLQDAWADALGAAGALLLTRGDRRRAFVRWLAAAVAWGAAIWLPVNVLIDGYQQRQQWPQLASFESSRELTRWQFVACGRPKLVAQHATQGHQALRIEFSTEHYACATYVWPLPDWSGYSALEFDAFLEGSQPLDFIVKLEDLHHNGRFQDRYNSTRQLQPGANHVRVDLAEVAQAPVGRRFDLKQVMRIQIFAVLLPTPRRVFFDHFALHP